MTQSGSQRHLGITTTRAEENKANQDAVILLLKEVITPNFLNQYAGTGNTSFEGRQIPLDLASIMQQLKLPNAKSSDQISAIRGFAKAAIDANYPTTSHSALRNDIDNININIADLAKNGLDQHHQLYVALYRALPSLEQQKSQTENSTLVNLVTLDAQLKQVKTPGSEQKPILEKTLPFVDHRIANQIIKRVQNSLELTDTSARALNNMTIKIAIVNEYRKKLKNNPNEDPAEKTAEDLIKAIKNPNTSQQSWITSIADIGSVLGTLHSAISTEQKEKSAFQKTRQAFESSPPEAVPAKQKTGSESKKTDTTPPLTEVKNENPEIILQKEFDAMLTELSNSVYLPNRTITTHLTDDKVQGIIKTELQKKIDSNQTNSGKNLAEELSKLIKKPVGEEPLEVKEESGLLSSEPLVNELKSLQKLHRSALESANKQYKIMTETFSKELGINVGTVTEYKNAQKDLIDMILTIQKSPGISIPNLTAEMIKHIKEKEPVTKEKIGLSNFPFLVPLLITLHTAHHAEMAKLEAESQKIQAELKGNKTETKEEKPTVESEYNEMLRLLNEAFKINVATILANHPEAVSALKAKLKTEIGNKNNNPSIMLANEILKINHTLKKPAPNDPESLHIANALNEIQRARSDAEKAKAESTSASSSSGSGSGTPSAPASSATPSSVDHKKIVNDLTTAANEVISQLNKIKADADKTVLGATEALKKSQGAATANKMQQQVLKDATEVVRLCTTASAELTNGAELKAIQTASSYTDAQKAATALNTQLADITTKMAEAATLLEGAQKSLKDSLVATQPNPAWCAAVNSRPVSGAISDAEKAKNLAAQGMMQDLMNTYERLRNLRLAAEGDDSAFVAIPEALEATKALIRAIHEETKNADAATHAPAGKIRDGDALLADDMVNMGVQFHLLANEMKPLTERKFEDRTKERVFADRAYIGTRDNYDKWIEYFKGNTHNPAAAHVLTVGRRGYSSSIENKTEPKLLDIGANRDNYFIFHPPGTLDKHPDDYKRLETVFYEEKSVDKKTFALGVIDLPIEISDRGLFAKFLYNNGNGVRIPDTDINGHTIYVPASKAKLESLIFKNMDPVITPSDAKAFMLKMDFPGCDPEQMAKDFMKFMEKERTELRTLGKKDTTGEAPGAIVPQRSWFGRSISAPMPHSALREAARQVLNSINASGQEVVPIDLCSNLQLMIAIKLLADLYKEKGELKCEIRFDPRQFKPGIPTKEQMDIMRADYSRTKDTDFKTIRGLSTQYAPKEAIQNANDMCKKVKEYVPSPAATENYVSATSIRLVK